MKFLWMPKLTIAKEYIIYIQEFNKTFIDFNFFCFSYFGVPIPPICLLPAFKLFCRSLTRSCAWGPWGSPGRVSGEIWVEFWYVGLDQVASKVGLILADGWWAGDAFRGGLQYWRREGIWWGRVVKGIQLGLIIGCVVDLLITGCLVRLAGEDLGWPQPVLVWSRAWVPSQTEARSWWWKRQILSTWSMVSDKSPGLRLCRKEFPQRRKAVKQSIKRKKNTVCVDRHVGRFRGRVPELRPCSGLN